MVEFPISSIKRGGHATRWRAKYPEKLSEYAKRVARSTDTLKDWIAKGKRSGFLPPLNSLIELPEWYSKHVGPVPDDLLAICIPAETSQAAAATKGESIELEFTVGELRKILGREITELNSAGSDGRRAILLTRIQRTADSLSKLESALAKQREQTGGSRCVLSQADRKRLAEQSAQFAAQLRTHREASARQIIHQILLRFGRSTKLHDLRCSMANLESLARQHKTDAQTTGDVAAESRADEILVAVKELKAADAPASNGPAGVTVLEVELAEFALAVIAEWLSERESLFGQYIALREESNPGDWNRLSEMLEEFPRHLVEKLIQDFSQDSDRANVARSERQE